jgi:hypothetical protein
MTKQFSDVSSKFGAPMGRREYGDLENMPNFSVNVFLVRMVGGGYDDGGAYWGAAIHGVQPLYCIRNVTGCAEELQQFVRARSRLEAAAKAGVKAIQLRKKLQIEHGWWLTSCAGSFVIRKGRIGSEEVVATKPTYHEAIDYILEEMA